MEHPDEGMIHAWLDDALAANEAAAFELHVRECASCSAAVAEARGFVAAASRIVSALDDVPGGVLPAGVAQSGETPATTQVTARTRAWWARPQMAAAALLVVVAGSVLVMPRGEDVGVFDAASDSVASGPSISPSVGFPGAGSPSAASPNAEASRAGAAFGSAAAQTAAAPALDARPLPAPVEAVADASARSANTAGKVASSARKAAGIAEQEALARALPARAEARREVAMSAPRSAPVATAPSPPTSPKVADSAIARDGALRALRTGVAGGTAAATSADGLGCYLSGDAALPLRFELRGVVQATIGGRVWFEAQAWPSTSDVSWRWATREAGTVDIQSISRGDTVTRRLRSTVRDSLGCR